MKEVVIQTENLSKSFVLGETTQHVLKNINLSIYKGDFTVIMGSSGSGKSTLLYAISSMDQPSGGEVKILGKPLSSLKGEQISALRSQNLGFIFQSMNLLPDLTVFENITYPAYQNAPKDVVNDKAIALLESFGLNAMSSKYPSQLSGGQQQRVAVMRALISNPEIIFGDEPTGALNSSAGKEVLDLLTEVNQKGQSIVMVTHDIKACTRGNRLLFLADGRIDGELNLGTYTPETEKEREQVVFDFLKAHHW